MLKKFGIGLAFVGALMFAGNSVFVGSVSADAKKDASTAKGEHKKGEHKKGGAKKKPEGKKEQKK